MLSKSCLLGWGNSLPRPGEGFGGAAASRRGETGSWAGICGMVVKRAARSGSLRGKFWGGGDALPSSHRFLGTGTRHGAGGNPHKNTTHETSGFAKHSLPPLI